MAPSRTTRTNGFSIPSVRPVPRGWLAARDSARRCDWLAPVDIKWAPASRDAECIRSSLRNSASPGARTATAVAPVTERAPREPVRAKRAAASQQLPHQFPQARCVTTCFAPAVPQRDHMNPELLDPALYQGSTKDGPSRDWLREPHRRRRPRNSKQESRAAECGLPTCVLPDLVPGVPPCLPPLVGQGPVCMNE